MNTTIVTNIFILRRRKLLRPVRLLGGRYAGVRCLVLPLQRLQRQRRQQRKVQPAGQARRLLEVRDVLEALQEGGRMFLGLPPQLGHARRSLVAARRHLGGVARWQQRRTEARHGLHGTAGAQAGEAWKKSTLIFKEIIYLSCLYGIQPIKLFKAFFIINVFKVIFKGS